MGFFVGFVLVWFVFFSGAKNLLKVQMAKYCKNYWLCGISGLSGKKIIPQI